MAGGPGASNGHVPAQLMTQGRAKSLRRIYHGNGKSAELHPAPGAGEAVAQFVVIGKVVHQRFEPADALELFFRGSHYGAQHEIQVAQEPSHEYAGGEIGAIAECFKVTGDGTVAYPPIKASDAAEVRVAEMTCDFPK